MQLIVTITIIFALFTCFNFYLIYKLDIRHTKRLNIGLKQVELALNVLYTNQEKILKLSNIKGFVELVKNEEIDIKREITDETRKTKNKRTI